MVIADIKHILIDKVVLPIPRLSWETGHFAPPTENRVFTSIAKSTSASSLPLHVFFQVDMWQIQCTVHLCGKYTLCVLAAFVCAVSVIHLASFLSALPSCHARCMCANYPRDEYAYASQCALKRYTMGVNPAGHSCQLRGLDGAGSPTR